MNVSTIKGLPISRIIFATTLAIVGQLWSFKLISSKLIGEPSFILMFCSILLTSLFIVFYDRASSLSLRELKIEMAKIEETRQEIEQREQSVRRIGLTVAQVAMFLAAFSRRATGSDDQKVEIAWLSKKAKVLLAEIRATPQETSAVFRHVESLPELDNLLRTDERKAKEKWKAMWDEVKKETHQE